MSRQRTPRERMDWILEMIGDAQILFWTCSRGCQGIVTWEGEVARCEECGTKSTDVALEESE